MKKSFYYLAVFLWSFAMIYWSISASAQSFFQGTGLVEKPTVTATAGGTTTLTKDSNTVQRFTGSSSQVVTLPDATTIPTGRYFFIANDATAGTISVNDKSNTLVAVVRPGSSSSFRLTAAAASNGTWTTENNYTVASNGGVVFSYSAGGISAAAATNLSWDASNVALNISGPINLKKAGLTNIELNDVVTEANVTGVVNGGLLSINATNTLFDLSAGEGHIVDSTTTPEKFIQIEWSSFTAQSVSGGVASRDFTYILLSEDGTIYQQATEPTPQERRDRIYIGRLNHNNRTSITGASSIPPIAKQVGSQLYDLTSALGSFNISGNVFSANGASMQISKSAGVLFQQSFNWKNSEKNPSTIALDVSTPQNFRYATATTLSGATTATITGAFYDNAGTITSIAGSNNQATVQRIFLLSSGNTIIQYGQTVYGTLADAIANIPYESFTVNPNISAGFGFLQGYLAVTKGATDLSNTSSARFLTAGKFGGGATSGGGGTSTLQSAYNNSPAQPQITVTSTLGALNIADASSTIGSIFRVTDNGASTRYFDVAAAGISTSGNAQISGLTTAGPVTTSSAGLLSSSATLVETFGGTNQSSYTTGDTLYASASNTLSKRAVGATKTALTVSGGVPVWDTTITSDNGSTNMRMEWARIVADAACSIASDISMSSNWITSCTRNATASYTLGMSWTEVPTCNVTAARALDNTRYTVSAWISAISKTSITIQWAANDDQQATILAAIAVADDSGSFALQCIGPR